MNAARSVRRTTLAAVAVFALAVPAITPRIYASDEIQYFAYLRSLWFDRDVSFENEYRWFYDAGIAHTAGFHETFLERTTATGHRINFGTIGAALLWAPFYAAADSGVIAARAAGSQVARDGYSLPYVAAVSFGSACYGLLALLIGARIASAVAGPPGVATFAVWIGTPLLFYMYVAPPMSHACSAFAVAMFVAAWLKVRERWSPAGCALLGALAALMAMVREQDVLIAAGALLDFVWPAPSMHVWTRSDGAARDDGVPRDGQRAGTERFADDHAAGGRQPDAADEVPTAASGVVRLRRRPPQAGGAGYPWRERVAGFAAAAAAGAIAFLPQALAYRALNGFVGPSPLVARKMSWLAPHAIEVLASPAHGWFWWTPLAAVALLGLVRLAFRPRATDGRRIALCMLAMVATQVYIAGAVESWTVAGAFGQRRFVGLSALLVVGLAAGRAATRSGLARTVFMVVVAASVWWNLGLMAQFALGLMDRQRLEPARNARTTLVTLPRMAPSIAWRYLVDRRSFYKVKE